MDASLSTARQRQVSNVFLFFVFLVVVVYSHETYFWHWDTWTCWHQLQHRCWLYTGRSHCLLPAHAWWTVSRWPAPRSESLSWGRWVWTEGPRRLSGNKERVLIRVWPKYKKTFHWLVNILQHYWKSRARPNTITEIQTLRQSSLVSQFDSDSPINDTRCFLNFLYNCKQLLFHHLYKQSDKINMIRLT